MKQFGSALDTYRAQVEDALRASLTEVGGMPLYGMLRYFMGYENQDLQPITGVSGKRIRPTLLLYIAEMFGGSPAALDLAVSIELFHNFTLIHDDIEDHDELRRGRPTVWKLWGVNHAINAGDVQSLLANRHLLRAIQTDPRAARAAAILNDCFMEVAEGQFSDFELSTHTLPDRQVTTEAYLEMIRKKTSVLLGAAAAGGGVVAGCDDVVRDTLFAYGESLGLAYQLADDMSSIWGQVHETGKDAFGDVIERKKTFPILYARDHGYADRLAMLYGNDTPLTASEIQEVVTMVDASGAREATRVVGEKYVCIAKEKAQALPLKEEVIHTLVQLVDMFVRFGDASNERS
jgi:geranylgeranyl diphosphate synthase, type I